MSKVIRVNLTADEAGMLVPLLMALKPEGPSTEDQAIERIRQLDVAHRLLRLLEESQ